MPDENTAPAEVEQTPPEQPVPTENEAVDAPVEPVDPPTPTDPADEEGEVAGGPEYPVVEVELSDEEKQAQEEHEALAADLPVGQTLPWVAETPSVVYDQLVAEAQEADEDAQPAE